MNRTWANILKELMSAGLSSPADEDQLLRTHWIVQYDPQSRNWDGAKTIKKKFDLRKYQGKSTQMLNELEEYIKGLDDACICYCDARNPSRDTAFKSIASKGEVRYNIQLWNSKFVRIGVTATLLPLLMAVRMRWPHEPEKYLEVVKLCETFAFRVYRLNGSRSNAGQATLFRLGHDVTQGSVDFDDTISRIKSELAHRGGDETYKYQMSKENQLWSEIYDWAGLRYFLYEYETHLASEKGSSPKVSWDELQKLDRKDTIEHILPQSIDSRTCWKKHFDSESHQRYIHDIGNLTLTKSNSTLSNKCFSDKRGIEFEGYSYITSPLYVERKLAKWNNWTTESIDERRTQLLDWARKRWHVDFGNTAYLKNNDDVDEENEG